MEIGDTTVLSEELLNRFDAASNNFENIMSDDMFQHGNLYMEEQEHEDDDNEPDDVIILHMDIREPLRTLQKIVEEKIGVDLKGYKFWLQDAQELEPHKNLVDQCVKGEGLVQINVQIQTTNQRINIVDVLKPTEAALAALAAEEANKSCKQENEQIDLHADSSQDSELEHGRKRKIKREASPIIKKERPCLNWVLDNKFKKDQIRLKIPEDPNEWTVPQVKYWFQWAIRQFDLNGFVTSDWAITGKELCSLTHEQFRKKLSFDPGNVFWTHLQLLKECKFVSVVHKAAEIGETGSNVQKLSQSIGNSSTPIAGSGGKEPKIMRKTFHYQKNSPVPSDGSPVNNSPSYGYGVGSGNNGQVQLWQFLLEILTDRDHINIIQWVGTEGEFKLTDPEGVARLWGEKKNKPAMNYEKLSRALRYYYDGDMISKVSGKRFAYKFDCDLKLLIGYDAAELSRLVIEKPFLDESVYLEHMNSQSDDE